MSIEVDYKPLEYTGIRCKKCHLSILRIKTSNHIFEELVQGGTPHITWDDIQYTAKKLITNTDNGIVCTVCKSHLTNGTIPNMNGLRHLSLDQYYQRHAEWATAVLLILRQEIQKQGIYNRVEQYGVIKNFD